MIIQLSMTLKTGGLLYDAEDLLANLFWSGVI